MKRVIFIVRVALGSAVLFPRAASAQGRGAPGGVIMPSGPDFRFDFRLAPNAAVQR